MVDSIPTYTRLNLS